MDYLNTFNAMLKENFGDLGPFVIVGVLGILLIALTLPFLLNRKEDPLDKLKKAQKQGGTGAEKTALRFETKNDKLEKYANFLEPQDEEELSAARLQLLRAGYRTKGAVRMFHFAQFALGLGLLGAGAIFAVIQSQTNPDVGMQKMLMTVLIPGVVGYYLPRYWVNKRVQERQEQMVNGFPDALDMMLVCVEAGQSMDQAIIRVSRELQAGFPALAEEFATVAYELKAGKDRPTVLKDMSERAGAADIASFVTVLIQSASFGTSVADALRVFAGEMRDKRVMRAEEKANTLPTKMTLATMMLTVPPLLIILIGPSVYGIATLLGGGAATSIGN
ncbi:type II secretion system F family protein [Pseudoruegeria sp. SHC-113]|uniref:type II secretion system F family protein n=1 Tax=Pseudoruegeria sp. SHC-113 TaxID=2855439 RepID=UPI0021BB25F5|nr:type II secretion system F family protein [Pseudoruegeria sp. SHC-113]MCT8161370.1 type II secretion system F family protein [Pseudoruegeria sp. SHC-113]